MAKGGEFSVTCIIHVVYKDERSCQLVGHDRSKHVNIELKDPAFMQDREAFVGMVIQGAEQLYDRLTANGPDRAESVPVDEDVHEAS